MYLFTQNCVTSHQWHTIFFLPFWIAELLIRQLWIGKIELYVVNRSMLRTSCDCAIKIMSTFHSRWKGMNVKNHLNSTLLSIQCSCDSLPRTTTSRREHSNHYGIEAAVIQVYFRIKTIWFFIVCFNWNIMHDDKGPKPNIFKLQSNQ